MYTKRVSRIPRDRVVFEFVSRGLNMAELKSRKFASRASTDRLQISFIKGACLIAYRQMTIKKKKEKGKQGFPRRFEPTTLRK